MVRLQGGRPGSTGMKLPPLFVVAALATALAACAKGGSSAHVNADAFPLIEGARIVKQGEMDVSVTSIKFLRALVVIGPPSLSPDRFRDVERKILVRLGWHVERYSFRTLSEKTMHPRGTFQATSPDEEIDARFVTARDSRHHGVSHPAAFNPVIKEAIETGTPALVVSLVPD
jgi:hypothetical protein